TRRGSRPDTSAWASTAPPRRQSSSLVFRQRVWLKLVQRKELSVSVQSRQRLPVNCPPSPLQPSTDTCRHTLPPKRQLEKSQPCQAACSNTAPLKSQSTNRHLRSVHRRSSSPAQSSPVSTSPDASSASSSRSSRRARMISASSMAPPPTSEEGRAAR